MKPFSHVTAFFFLLLFAACAIQTDETHFVQFESESFQKNWAISDLNPEIPYLVEPIFEYRK